MAENVDYEQIYQLTFRKQWAELLELVYKYSKFASSDELVRRAVNTFENEFFGELDKVIAKDDIETVLENSDNQGRTEFMKLIREEAFNIAAGDYDNFRRKLIPCFDDFYKTAVEIIPGDDTAPMKVLDFGGSRPTMI